MDFRQQTLVVVAVAATVLTGGYAPAADAATADLRAATARAAGTAGAPLVVNRRRASGLASFVRRTDRGDLHPTLRGRAAVDKAADFLARHGELFGLADAARETTLRATRRDAGGWTHLRWQQMHAGIEVFGGALAAHLAPDGRLRVVNGTTVPLPGPLATTPAVPQAEAERVARVGARGGAPSVADARLVIYDRGVLRGAAPDARLAWGIELEAPTSGRRELVMVDALAGLVLDRLELTPDALTRQLSQTSPDAVVWSEGDPDPIPGGWAGGTAAQIADWRNEIDGARESYNFHGSLSLGTYVGYDGADAPMLTVHDRPGIGCPNAYWGSGDTTNFCPGVTSDDVVSHEWGHAYTSYTSDLVYAWQPGALNESYSDVWGESVDLVNGRQTDAPNALRAADGSACSTFGTFVSGLPTTDVSVRWLVAEDSAAFGSPIRDMWHPECRADPGRVGSDIYHCVEGDGGGVHSNSGVPNHLYALLVDGGTYNGVTVPAIGLVKAANILWRAQSVYETPLSDFADHADALAESCADLVGAPLGAPVVTPPATWTTAAATITPADCVAVAAATDAVELRDDPPCGFTPILQPGPPALCAGLGDVEPVATYDFETSLAPWTAGTRAIANPATYDGGTWLRSTSPPDGHPGAAAFTADPIVGDCDTDDESGVSYLESPAFVVPTERRSLHVAFTHWIATEPNFDGGNVKVSVNGGPFVLVPPERFAFNPYNRVLVVQNNTAPTAGEPSWSGADAGSFDGSWGESQLDLIGLAGPGDSVRVRFELGMDGCNGLVGWYVDDVRVHTCSAETPLCPAEPVPGCKAAPFGRAKLALKDNIVATRDRLQWSWSAGTATTLAEVGNPTAGTRYAFCLWDWRANVPTLMTALEVPTGAAWKTSPHGARYTDGRGTAGGVTRVNVKTGLDRKASVSVQAKGAALALPDAASLSLRFAAEPRVTAQLVTSGGTCWTSDFGAADFKTNSIPKATASHVGP